MNENNENGVEITNIGKGNAANGKNEMKEEILVPWPERIRRLTNWLTIEPFLVLYLFSQNVGGLAIEQFDMEKACRSDLNYTEIVCTNAVKLLIDDEISRNTRKESSILKIGISTWQYPMETVLPALLAPSIGAWSDRTGNRKVLIILPAIGEIVSTCGLLLSTYFFLEWHLLSTAIIKSVPTALSGGYTIALMGSYSYLADITTVEARTFRLGVVVIIVILCGIFGFALSGILLHAFGYFGVFAIQLTLHCLGLSYVYFKIRDVRSEATEGTFMAKLKSFFNPYNVWETISLVIVTPFQQRIKIILIICAYILIIGPVTGEMKLEYSYAFNRYLMSTMEFSFFVTYRLFIQAVGTTVAITLFSKYLKMHDSFIGIIATACKTTSSLVYGLAPTKQWLYAGPAFDFFGIVGGTVIRSIGTKVVDPDKVCTVCSLLDLAHAVTASFVPLYNKIFEMFLNTMPGAVFFLSSIIYVLAFFIFVILYVMHKKQNKDIVVNPAEKEKHTYENDVTAL